MKYWAIVAGSDTTYVLAAPSYYQVDDAAWHQLVGQTNDPDRYVPDAPNRHLAEIAQRQGLRFLDLLPAVREAQQGGGHLYYPSDGHWTAEGHAFAARQIADYLLNEGLTPRP